MRNSDFSKGKESGQGNIVPDLILKGEWLLTMVEGQQPIKNASVSIKNDRIIDIQSPWVEKENDKAVKVIDIGPGIIMPGLINAHSHTAMTLFRGIADDLPLKEWLYEKIFPAEAKYLTPDNVYWGTLLGCLEMIASGTTSVVDGYFFEDGTLRAVYESGLRGLIAQGVIDFSAPGVADPKENLRVGRQFIEKYADFSDLITPGIFCHSPVTCSEETLKGAMNISDDYKVPLQIHLSETEEEVKEVIKKTGKRPVNYLKSIGILNENLITAHTIHVDDEELDLIQQKKAKIVNLPESNMKLSSGVARIPEMLKKGIIPGLGTDGCASNNNLDLFLEMDTASKLQKIDYLDPTALDALSVLKMATFGGAGIMGLEKEIGTIEVGKKADVITIDLDSPHLVPCYNPVSTLVYAANGGDVRDVIVNGRILMEDRMFTTLDSDRIMSRVTEICRDIII